MVCAIAWRVTFAHELLWKVSAAHECAPTLNSVKPGEIIRATLMFEEALVFITGFCSEREAFRQRIVNLRARPEVLMTVSATAYGWRQLKARESTGSCENRNARPDKVHRTPRFLTKILHTGFRSFYLESRQFFELFSSLHSSSYRKLSSLP